MELTVSVDMDQKNLEEHVRFEAKRIYTNALNQQLKKFFEDGRFGNPKGPGMKAIDAFIEKQLAESFNSPEFEAMMLKIWNEKFPEYLAAYSNEAVDRAARKKAYLVSGNLLKEQGNPS